MATTVDAFRKLVLALPGVVEGEHHGHPDFRLNGHVFASLHPDGARAMVRMVPGADQQRLVARDPAAWAPASGAWGRAGCMLVELAKAKRMVVAAALAEAWLAETARQASKQPKKPQPKPQPKPEPKPRHQPKPQPKPQPEPQPVAAPEAKPRPEQEPRPRPKPRKKRRKNRRSRRARRSRS